MTYSGLFFSSKGGRRDALPIALGVSLPLGFIILAVAAYFFYRSRRGSGNNTAGEVYKAQALRSDDPLEKLSAEMEFGQASLFNEKDGRRTSAGATQGNVQATAASMAMNNGGAGHNMPDSGKPLDLGLGTLFPTDKTPQVMSNSVAKGMQEARVNGVHGNRDGNGHAGVMGTSPLVPNNLDMGRSPARPHIPEIVPEGLEDEIQGLQDSDRILGGAADYSMGQAKAAAAPLAPQAQAAAALASRPPLAPGNPGRPSSSGSLQLPPKGWIGESPSHPRKIADKVLGGSMQTKKTPSVAGSAAGEGVALGSAAPPDAQESGEGVLHWRDATVIDDTPLQKQFEDFMNQLGKAPTPSAAKKKRPPIPKKAGNSPMTPSAEGGGNLWQDSPSHQSATIVGSGLGQSPRVEDPQSIQRKRVMDLHKQMFDGQHHISDPLELPGDKGISYYQGASSLQGRMTSGETLNKKPTPVQTEIRDEDEMWG